MKKLTVFILSVIFLGVFQTFSFGSTDDVNAILTQIKDLQNKKGVYISGRGKFDYQYYWAQGQAVNTNLPVVGDNPLIQADFNFEGRPFQFLKVGGTLRLKNDVSGFYGAGTTFSGRDIYLETILYRFIRLRLGNFRMQLSPLTLNLVEDQNKYEPRIFKEQKSDEYYENFLNGDGSFYLEGFSSDFGLQFGSKNADFLSTSVIPNTFKTKSYISRIDTAANSVAYDRYMFGGQAEINKDKIYNLQWNGNFVYDIQKTKIPGTTQDILHNGVNSASFKFNILNFLLGTKGQEKSFTLKAEYAQSYTLTNSVNKNNITDYAFIPSVEISYMNTKLYGQMVDVGNEFYSPGAQSWSYKATGWNYLPSQGLVNNLLFNTYNTKVQVIHRFNRPLHIAQPMGIATPNRKGYVAGLKTQTLKFLTAEGSFTILDEIRPIGNKEKRHFQKIFAGAEIPLNKIVKHSFVPILTGSYSIENENRVDDTTTTTNESEKIDSQILTAGLEVPMAKKISFLAGFKQITQKGKTYFDIDNSNTPLRIDGHSPYIVDMISQEISAGFLYQLNKFSNLQLNGTYITCQDNSDSAKAYDFYLVRALYIINF